MKAPILAKSAIDGKRASISSRVNPSTAAARRTFSRPVNSGLKPDPSSSIAAMRPFTRISPALGRSVPQIICNKVDFPDPLRPMIPTVSARPTLSSTPRTAQNSS